MHLMLVYAAELYPELGYYGKVIGVDLKTAVDPTLANTFPAGYQHMVDLLPGVMHTPTIIIIICKFFK